MGFKRRSLLKASAVTAAGWALGGSGWAALGQRYGEALAAPARRKYALLVGLNQYGGDDADCPDLRGCLNDLELQRQLLIHRYAFAPEDILTLSNREANRSRVQGTLISHLLQQAGPEDTVLFHFSGYGSRIRTAETAALQRSLVLYDSCSGSKSNRLQDWPESSLMAILTALPSDRVVAILDTSHDLPPQGASAEALRLRSRPSQPSAPFDSVGESLAQTLAETLGKRLGDRPGNGSNLVVLRAAQPQEAAVEFESQAGPVGLLTYSLCQQLWQAGSGSTWGNTLEGTIARFQQTLGIAQRPKLVNARLQGKSLDKVGLRPRTDFGCAGAITQIKRDGSLQLWLGGLSAEALAHCGEGALLRVDQPGGWATAAPILAAAPPAAAPEAGSSQASSNIAPNTTAIAPNAASTNLAPANATAPWPQYILLQDRHGLVAQGYPLAASGSPGESRPSALLAVSQPLQEQVRIIPRNLDLSVGLDNRFNRIERVDATSALTSIPSVSVVALQNDPTDYIFGRVVDRSAMLVASLPQPGGSSLLSQDDTGKGDTDKGDTGLAEASGQPPQTPPLLPETKYGLLTLNQQVLPATVSASAEAIKTAIQRLQPYLETLRAEKALQLLENTHSSGMALEVRWETLRAAKGGKPEETALRISEGNQGDAKPISIAQLSAGDQVRYTLKNEGDRPLYILLLGVNSLGQWLMPFRPDRSTTAPSGTSSRPTSAGTTLNDPISPGSSLKGEWPVESQKGITALYMVAIAAPFDQAYALLSSQKQDIVEALSLQRLRNPFALAEALLADLQVASQDVLPRVAPSEAHYALNTNAWATFRYAYEVS